MHLCLSCNQPCSLSSVFCDACRLALLERRTQEEHAELVGVGGREVLAKLTLVSQTGASDLSSRSEAAEAAAVQPSEREALWSWDTTDISLVEALADGGSSDPTDAPLVQTSSPSTRWTIPKPVRLALLIFLLVGALALLIDGSLVVLSLGRSHERLQSLSHGAVGSGSKQLMLTPVSRFSVPSRATTRAADNTFSLSTSRLSFTVAQGQVNPPAQTVMLLSSGQSSFSWQVVSTPPSWLSFSSTQGSARAGEKAQLIVNVQTAQLVPSTYTAHLLVKAANDQGSLLRDGFQPLAVVLNVLVPCSLNATPTMMVFSATLLQPVPPTQTLSLKERGDCIRPVNWQIRSSANWVSVSSISGYDTGSGSVIMVQATNSARQLVGTFKAYLILQATDNQSVLLSDSPLTIPVTLTVGV